MRDVHAPLTAPLASMALRGAVRSPRNDVLGVLVRSRLRARGRIVISLARARQLREVAALGLRIDTATADAVRVALRGESMHVHVCAALTPSQRSQIHT